MKRERFLDRTNVDDVIFRNTYERKRRPPRARGGGGGGGGQSVAAVPDLDDHAAAVAQTLLPVVVPALGHRFGLGGLDGLHPAVPGHRFLGEILHGVGDARPVRVVRLGREAHRFRVIVVAAAAGGLLLRHSVAVVLLMAAAQRLVQFGRVLQQALHEHRFLRVVVRPMVLLLFAGRAGPAARQRSVAVVHGAAAQDRRQVFSTSADAAHDVRAAQRRRRLFEPVQRADRPPGRGRHVGLHVEALAPEQQRRFRERPLRFRRRRRAVGERHVDHAARVGGRRPVPQASAAVIVLARRRRVHLRTTFNDNDFLVETGYILFFSKRENHNLKDRAHAKLQ